MHILANTTHTHTWARTWLAQPQWLPRFIMCCPPNAAMVYKWIILQQQVRLKRDAPCLRSPQLLSTMEIGCVHLHRSRISPEQNARTHQFASEIVILTTDKCVSQCSVCLKLLALRRDLLTSTNRRATAASQLSAVNVDRKYCAVCVSEYENWLDGKDSDVFDVQSHTLQPMASTKGMRSDTIDTSKISHKL